MKFTILCFCSILLLPAVASSQTLRIFSAEDKQPLVHARVNYRWIDEKRNAGLLSNMQGIVVLPQQDTTRQRIVEIAYVGYETVADTLSGVRSRSYYLRRKSIHTEELVVTAQYAPGSAESSVYKMRIIDRERIESQAAQTLRDVLATELNVRLSQDNILGSSMSLQGISGENVKILRDGVPVIGRQNGNLDLSQINLHEVERIEIVEGPLAVSYGTNALAGVINLVSKRAQSSMLEAGLDSYYESVGHYNANANVGFRSGKNQIGFSAMRNFFDGWKEGEKLSMLPEAKKADSSRYLSWKPKEQHSASWLYTRQMENFTLGYKSEYFTETVTNRGMPRQPYSESAFDDYYRTRRIDNSISLNGSPLPETNLSVIIAYNDYSRRKNTLYRDLTTLEERQTTNPGDQDTSGLSLLGTRGTFGTCSPGIINYELGYDVSIENAAGVRIDGVGRSIGDYALFASAEYKPLENLTLRPGLRYAYNSAYAHPFVPSINALYKPFDNFSLRASYARGFRSPSLKELYFYFVDVNHNIVGNPALSAENSNNYIVSGRYAQAYSGSAWTAEASFFYNDISKLITLAQGKGTEYSYVNIGVFRTAGVQLRAEFISGFFRLSAGATWTGRYNALSESHTLNSFLYSPELQSSFSYRFGESGFQAAGYYKYSGAVPGYLLKSEGSVERMVTDAYHSADLTFSYAAPAEWLTLSAGSKNIFDVKNINTAVSGGAHSSSSGTMPIAMGRSFFVRMALKLTYTGAEE